MRRKDDRTGGLKHKRAESVVEEVDAAIGAWPSFAERAGVDSATARRIANAHRRLDSLTE